MVSTHFESKAELEIHTSEVCAAGASIPVEVKVCLQEQINPRELRLELVGMETYYMTVGFGRNVATARKAMEFTRVPYTVMKQPSLFRGVMSSHAVEIQIPVDAPPSCRGEELDVYWILKAVLDAKKRFYWIAKEAEMPIQVMSTPTSAKGAMADLPQEQSYKDCNLSLEVPNTTVSKGAVSGSLKVNALRNLQFRGIRIELRQIEDVAGWKEVNDAVAQQELSGPASVNTSNPLSFAFSLPLPPDAPPTTVTPHSSLRWQVKAILDRKMRRDISIERDVIIYTGLPTEAIPPINS